MGFFKETPMTYMGFAFAVGLMIGVLLVSRPPLLPPPKDAIARPLPSEQENGLREVGGNRHKGAA